VLAAPPDAPGAAALLARVRAEASRGADVAVLLTGGAIADGDVPPDVGGARVSACARSARDRGVAIPPALLPSSLVAFFRDVPEGARLWGLLG
jgi:hypothetical protein